MKNLIGKVWVFIVSLVFLILLLEFLAFANTVEVILFSKNICHSL